MIIVSKGEYKKYVESDRKMTLEVFVEKLRGGKFIEAKEDKTVSRRDEIKSKLIEKGIEFKGNVKTEELEKMLEEAE